MRLLPHHHRTNNEERTEPSAADDIPSELLRSDAFLKHAMDAWGDAVYRVALAHTGSPADADDVYQDVFLRLLKDTTAFAHEEHLKAWLLRVTVNRCHDLGRSIQSRRTEPLEGTRIEPAAPDAFRSDVWEVVGALPFDLRTVVHLYYVEGYSTAEIAEIAQCEPATVRTRLHRARERLRLDLLPDQTSRHRAHEPHAPKQPEPREEPNHVRETREHPPANAGGLPSHDGRHPCAGSPAI